MSVAASTAASSFLSTPSARRATLPRASRAAGRRDFYPRPPRGGRRRKSRSNPWWSIFLSTPSARRATRFSLCFLISTSNFYPRPPRGGRRTSRTEHRQYKQFLSTPSARRATSPPGSVCQAYRYFYPRPPRGGRPHRWCRYSWQWRISIHALREEGDQLSGPVMLLPYQFLSTPSARRATQLGEAINLHNENFYPRPPRGGRLYKVKAFCKKSKHFYPRPPRGGRQLPRGNSEHVNEFLSTPSARRATRSAKR